MRKVFGTILLIGALAFAFGCKGDIVLEEPPPLNGDYSGYYEVTTGSGTFRQPVLFTFGDDNYKMEMDTTSPDFSSHSFCTVFGQYSLTEGVRLLEDDWLPLGGEFGGSSFDACIQGQNPEGTFTIIRGGSGSSVQLKQQTNDTLRKEIILTRVTTTE